MVAIFGGAEVPCARYATYGAQDLSYAILGALGIGWGCLLANHGAIACGETLAKAIWRAEELEALAQQVLIASQLGDPVILDAEEIARVSQTI